MSLTPIIRALVQAGATPEMILSAVEAYEQDKLQEVEKKREYERERKRQYRMSRNVPGTSGDNGDTPPSPPNGFPPDPLSFTPPLPPQEKTSPLRESQKSRPADAEAPRPPKEKIQSGKGGKTRGTRLPQGWSLPEEWGDWAEEQGMSVQEILLEEEKFRDYWHARAGPNGVKLDWQATWRNWIRKHLEDDRLQRKTAY